MDREVQRLRLPKAHAASFASLSYTSAYMRRHYPAECSCGILNSQPVGFYSPRVVLNEARRVDITILPPEVHLSGEGFTVEEDSGALRVGLSYCKGLSEEAISLIVSGREIGHFASVTDVHRRTGIERDSLGNLAESGFLDALPGYRADLESTVGEIASLPKKKPAALLGVASTLHPFGSIGGEVDRHRSTTRILKPPRRRL